MYAPTSRREPRRLPAAAAVALAAALLAALVQGLANAPSFATAPAGPVEAPQPAGA